MSDYLTNYSCTLNNKLFFDFFASFTQIFKKVIIQSEILDFFSQGHEVFIGKDFVCFALDQFHLHVALVLQSLQ